jgi:hypothetical protein
VVTVRSVLRSEPVSPLDDREDLALAVVTWVWRPAIGVAGRTPHDEDLAERVVVGRFGVALDDQCPGWDSNPHALAGSRV